MKLRIYVKSVTMLVWDFKKFSVFLPKLTGKFTLYLPTFENLNKNVNKPFKPNFSIGKNIFVFNF